MLASSDDESVASDRSDLEDDEEYEELQKDDYCAERIRTTTEAVFLKKMVDSELNEMLQLAWDDEFKVVAQAYINREPRRGADYEKKYTVVRHEEAPFFFLLTIKTDNGEAKFLVPSLEVVIVRLMEYGAHWRGLSANDCANAAIRSVHFELWPLCPVGILSRLIFFAAWLVFDRKAILRYSQVPIVGECLSSQFIRNLRMPGAIMPRERTKDVASYYSFMQRVAEEQWDQFAGEDFDEFHRHFNARGHAKPRPKCSWRKNGAWLKWVPTANPRMRDYYDEVKNGIDAVVPAALRLVYWRDKDSVANDALDVMEKLREFRESFKERNERENRLTERSRAARNMHNYTAKQASALRKNKEHRMETIREQATMHITRRAEQTRIDRANRTAAAPNATVANATLGATVLRGLPPFAPPPTRNPARTARVTFDDDFGAAEGPDWPDAAQENDRNCGSHEAPAAEMRTPPPGPSNIDLYERIANLKAEIAVKDGQLRGKATCIDELLKKLSDWQSNEAQWEVERAALVAEKDAKMEQAKVASLEAKCASLEADLRRTSDESGRLKSDLETLREELEHRAEDVKALGERLAQNEVDVYEERQAMKTDFEQRAVTDSMEQMVRVLGWQEKESALRAEIEQMQKDVREKAFQLEQEKAELQSEHLLAIERLTKQNELLLAQKQLAALRDQRYTPAPYRPPLRHGPPDRDAAGSTMIATPTTPRARAGPVIHAQPAAPRKPPAKRSALRSIPPVTPLATRVNGAEGVPSPRVAKRFAKAGEKEYAEAASRVDVLQVAGNPSASQNRPNDVAKNTPKPPFRVRFAYSPPFKPVDR